MVAMQLQKPEPNNHNVGETISPTKPKVETLPDSISAKLRQLNNYRPSLPLVQRGRCFICGKEYEGIWRQLVNANGWDLKPLCEDCFKLWLKHFGGGLKNEQ
jgi:hypothetical protein